MNKQPTGGKWTVATDSPNPYWRGDGTEVLSDYGRIADCSVSGLRDLAECQANARLIASAPEMAARLRELVAWADSYRGDTLPKLEGIIASIRKVLEVSC